MPSSIQTKPLEPGDDREFNHIELTEDEITEALRAARELKHYTLRRLEYGQNLNKMNIPKQFKSQDLFDMFKLHCVVDETNTEVIENLCHYFTNDDKFKGDPNKGLLLFGGVGIGKTTLMQFFRRNQKASYRVISCREIESDFSSEGEKSVRNCSYNIKISENMFCQTEIGFCFDDLGTEANAKHFGKDKNVMAEILLNRYDNNIPSCYTHITTNMNTEELKTQYGTRVHDRMKEMFNIITFDKNAKSRRK